MDYLRDFWSFCLTKLQEDLSVYQFQTWVSRLTVQDEKDSWIVYAPNNFMMGLVRDECFGKILAIKDEFPSDIPPLQLKVGVGKIKLTDIKINKSKDEIKVLPESNIIKNQEINLNKPIKGLNQKSKNNFESISDHKKDINLGYEHTRLKMEHNFENLVVGKGNQLAYSAALSISDTLGKKDYNPFFVYGSTGLGKTHLVQALANKVFHFNHQSKIRYIHAEKFISDYIKAVRGRNWDDFKKYYQSLDLLILDDVQFIAGKEKTMEEFFYLFNRFLDEDKQVILTCDRLPSNLEKMDDRLKSRFSWGLTVEIEAPELEMRVAILQKKSALVNFHLPDDIAFFIAQSIKSNVRDLEGALNRVRAHCRFTKEEASINLVKIALKDILASANRQLSIEEIQKIVANFYHIKIADMRGKKRVRSIVRPRQIAMSLAKELTQKSLPMIGDAFGGRDHTTVLHANKIVQELRENDADFAQDYDTLLNILNN